MPASRRNPKSAPRIVREPRVVGTSLEILRAPVFASLPWLVHGFSTRQGGVWTCYGGKALNLGITSHDAKANVERNRRMFLTALRATAANGDPWPLLQVRQIHSAIVHRVNATMPKPLAGDGLITDAPALLLAIKTADCVPILVADIKRRVVGAFHAGWRGTVARIVEKGVGEMRRQFGSLPRDLRAAIVPPSGAAVTRLAPRCAPSSRRNSLMPASSSKRSSTPMPSTCVSLAVPEPARARDTAILGRKSISTWWKRIGVNCKTLACERNTSA